MFIHRIMQIIRKVYSRSFLRQESSPLELHACCSLVVFCDSFVGNSNVTGYLPWNIGVGRHLLDLYGIHGITGNLRDDDAKYKMTMACQPMLPLVGDFIKVHLLFKFTKNKFSLPGIAESLGDRQVRRVPNSFSRYCPYTNDTIVTG